jgi:hypothetical protein
VNPATGELVDNNSNTGTMQLPEIEVTGRYPYYSSNNPDYQSSFDKNAAWKFSNHLYSYWILQVLVTMEIYIMMSAILMETTSI